MNSRLSSVTALSLKLVTVMCALNLIGFAKADDSVPLKVTLPKPMLTGTPVPLKLPNLEAPRSGRRPEIMVPKGSLNLALNKPVTGSDKDPVLGDLTLITDGEKSGDEGNFVELGQGKQWVQIDLQKSSSIYAVALWHYHSQARVYFDVVVQISDDPTFTQGVKTIYNSDTANELGLGAGQDHLYIETYEGRLIEAKGISGRYVRLYSHGNSSNEMNHYIEVEVYGKTSS